MFGAVVAASTSALPEAEEGEKQKQHHDREEDEEEESDHDRAMGASKEKMEERVVDGVVRSRQINRDSEEGREAVYCVFITTTCTHSHRFRQAYFFIAGFWSSLCSKPYVGM